MNGSNNYELLHAEGTRTPIKGWVRGVPLEERAREQLRNIATLPFVGPWVAVMPDVHLGIGATVGSVVPTRGAIIPAAVGVDIGCGMAAVRTTLTANQLPDDLAPLRHAIERSIPAHQLSEVPMAELHPRVQQLLDDLERQRDELRVRMHLAKAEGREELAKLDEKLDELRARAGRVRGEAQQAAGDISDAAKLLASEIREGFDRIRDAI